MSGKGSNFERQVCKQLSLWWTDGKRDDVFWRSSQSGGRATQRAKSGQSTYGSYGDIAAVDPIGEPLLKLFTIELKRGRSHGSLADLIDMPSSAKKRPFEDAISQAIRGHEMAGSKGWLLIFRRDRKETVVCADLKSAQSIFTRFPPSRARFDFFLHNGQRVRFVALPLQSFFLRVNPAQIIALFTA